MNSSLPPLVAYHRVFTERRGRSGLGLDAQRAAVVPYAAGRDLLGEFLKVESGRRDNRLQLVATLALSCQRRVVLVIAKPDRQAHSVAFISNPIESGVEFVAVDMPQANRLTLHISAVVAENERGMISQRTRPALAAAKAEGTKLRNSWSDMAIICAAACKRQMLSHERSARDPLFKGGTSLPASDRGGTQCQSHQLGAQQDVACRQCQRDIA